MTGSQGQSWRNFLDLLVPSQRASQHQRWEALLHKFQHRYHHGPYCECHMWHRWCGDVVGFRELFRTIGGTPRRSPLKDIGLAPGRNVLEIVGRCPGRAVGKEEEDPIESTQRNSGPDKRVGLKLGKSRKGPYCSEYQAEINDKFKKYVQDFNEKVRKESLMQCCGKAVGCLSSKEDLGEAKDMENLLRIKGALMEVCFLRRDWRLKGLLQHSVYLASLV